MATQSDYEQSLPDQASGLEMDTQRMQKQIDALADVLADYVAEVDRDGLPPREWSDALLDRMRAALRLAGRLP